MFMFPLKNLARKGLTTHTDNMTNKQKNNITGCVFYGICVLITRIYYLNAALYIVAK